MKGLNTLLLLPMPFLAKPFLVAVSPSFFNTNNRFFIETWALIKTIFEIKEHSSVNGYTRVTNLNNQYTAGIDRGYVKFTWNH